MSLAWKLRERVSRIDPRCDGKPEFKTIQSLVPVAASTAITAATTSAAAVTSTTSAAWWPTTAAVTTSPSAAGPRFSGLGDIHRQRPAVVLLGVQRFDCFIGFVIDRHFDEAEASRATGFAIHHDLGSGNRSVLREKCDEIILRALPGQIANV